MSRKEAVWGLRGVAFAALALVSIAWVPEAYAVQTVSTNFSMPIQLKASVAANGCENSPGPQITFNGSLILGGVDLRMIFRNNINKDVHTLVEDVKVVSAVTAGQTIVLPKQPVLGGVGGNPFIWVQMVDTNGNPLSGEVYLGRCVQGPFNTYVGFSAAAVAQAVVEVADCTNNPGPFVYVGGSTSFSPGINARFIFRNNDNPVGGPHQADAIVDVNVVPTGYSLVIPKQPVQGGVGGNPWISVGFSDADGQAIGNESLLGRCVQLLPGN